MSALLSQPLSQRALVERSVFLFGKLCLIAAVGLAHALGDKFNQLKTRSVPQVSLEAAEQDTGPVKKPPLNAYDAIVQRNIFGEKPAAKIATPAQPETKTQLSLRLVGTSVSSSGTPFAIVENTTKKEQDVFEINEMVHGQAKLVEVQTESIKIEHNGQLETLALDDGTSDSGTAPSGEAEDGNQTEFTVPEQELSDALANLPRLLSQARAVPYFRNGQSVGMRLFAIRQGSLYEKLGLKNGDIIKTVNSTNVGDPAQALKIFEQLKDERSIAVEVERNGEAVALRYAIR